MTTEIVRELLLRRRRARVPWVYLVYHRHAAGSVLAAKIPDSVLPPEKGRDVERRRKVPVEYHAPLLLVT